MEHTPPQNGGGELTPTGNTVLASGATEITTACTIAKIEQYPLCWIVVHWLGATLPAIA